MNTGGCFSTMTVPESLRTLLGIRWLEMGIAAWRWFLYSNFPTIPFLVNHFETFSNLESTCFTLYLLYLFDLFDFTDLYIVLMLDLVSQWSIFFEMFHHFGWIEFCWIKYHSKQVESPHATSTSAGGGCLPTCGGADDLTWSFLKVREEPCLMPNMIWKLPWQIVQKLHTSLYLGPRNIENVRSCAKKRTQCVTTRHDATRWLPPVLQWRRSSKVSATLRRHCISLQYLVIILKFQYIITICQYILHIILPLVLIHHHYQYEHAYTYT